MSITIQPDSLVTLNYRISDDTGVSLISTFEATPATLRLGCGELSPSLEARLIGLEEGSHTQLDFAAGEVFGPHSPELVTRISRKNLPPDTELEVRSVLSFTAPDGAALSGQVLEFDAETLLIDFNHPLAGKAIRFDVQIIGVISGS